MRPRVTHCHLGLGRLSRADGPSPSAAVMCTVAVAIVAAGVLALKRRLPMISPFREIAEAGGLISYGLNV